MSPAVRICLLAALVFSPTLAFQYVNLDDLYWVQAFNYFADPAHLATSLTRGLWQPLHMASAYYRPAMDAFWIIMASTSRALFGGPVAAWLHGGNLALHALVCGLLYRLLREVTDGRLAAWGAAIFAVHPAPSAAVAWVCGANELLLATAALGCALAALRYSAAEAARRPPWRALAASAGCLLAGLFSKESAVALSPLLAGLVWLRSPVGPGRARRVVTLLVVHGATGALWLGLRQHATQDPQPLSAADLLASGQALWVGVPVYVGKWVWPWPVQVLPDLADVSPWWGAAVLAAAALRTLRLPAGPRAWQLWAAAWWVAFLAPTFLHFASSDSLFMLRLDRLYTASVGAVVWLACDPALRALVRARPLWLDRGALVAVAVAACVTLAWTAPYRNPSTFYGQAVQSSPNLPSAHVHLADTLIGVDDARAEAGYLQALALHPGEKLAHNNLGVLYLRRSDLAAAEREFTAELRRDPDYVQAWFNLALVQGQRGERERAEALLLHVLSLNPDYTEAYSQLAGIYASRGDQAKLLRALQAMERLGVQITTRPAMAEP
jgi:hypothetical protein